MKKIIRMILFCVFLFAICYSANAEVPIFVELENNDARNTAEVLCMNAIVKGSLNYQDKYDTDCYRICVPGNGRISISLKHDYIDTSNRYCKLNLYPVNGDSPLWSASNAGNKAEVNYYSFYLGEGEYDLVVTGEQRSSSNYQVQVNYTPESHGESEYNNSPETADVILANERYYGSLSYEGDVDYYQLTLDNAGEVSLGFEHEYFDNSSTYYRISISKGISGPTIRSVDLTGKDSDWLSYNFYLAAGTYYVRIEDYYWTDRPYAFTLNYALNENVELESNNSFDYATVVPLNTQILGSMNNDDDHDVFKFVLEEPGEIQLKHAHEYFDNGSTYYRISLYDGINADALFSADLTGRDSDWLRWAVYLPAGEYYLQYEPYYWTTRPYAFTLNYTTMPNIEVERNNTYKNASAIQTNTTYNGSLMSDDDVDYYVFTLEQLSEVNVNFDFEYFDNGSTYFELYLDLDMRDDANYYVAKLSGRDNQLSSYPFYLPAGTYYIRLESYYHTSRPYFLSVNAVPCNDVEVEWNNSYGTATPISIGQSVQGSLRYEDDIDYYRIDVTEPCSVRVYFEHEWFDNGSTYYQVYLDGQANNSNRLMSISLSGRDSDIQTKDVYNLQPGTYYLSVDSYYHTGRPYTITIG